MIDGISIGRGGPHALPPTPFATPTALACQLVSFPYLKNNMLFLKILWSPSHSEHYFQWHCVKTGRLVCCKRAD